MLIHRHPNVATSLWIVRSPLPTYFNTQPRGGGCLLKNVVVKEEQNFNTQPRGGGCALPKKARKISRLNTVFR